MSSLVRELNSESSDDDSLLTRNLPNRDYDFKGLYESPAWRGLNERGYSEEDGALPRLHERKPSGDLHFSSTQGGQGSQSKRRSSLGANEQRNGSHRREGDTPDWEEERAAWVNR
nr:uncharacterized protein LOC113801219 [Penaeus vannamei]